MQACNQPQNSMPEIGSENQGEENDAMVNQLCQMHVSMDLAFPGDGRGPNQLLPKVICE